MIIQENSDAFKFFYCKNELLQNTVKALLSPRGTYLILDTPEGGLLEGGLFKTLDEKDIYDRW